MSTVDTRATRTGLPPSQLAELVLGGVVLINVVIVEVLFFTGEPGKNGVLTLARFVGLHAALLLMLQLTLVARIPWLDRRLGMDRLTRWHAVTGFTLLWTVVTHGTLVVAGFARLDQAPFLDTFLALAGVVSSLLGMLAAAVIVSVAVLSMRALRRRISYELWHAIHLGMYAAVTIALFHQLLEGSTFNASTGTRIYWWTLWALVLGAFVSGRIVTPLVRNARHGFQVAAVVPESDRVVSVHVTGRDLHRLPARAGQFMIWRFPGHSGWWQANPFSLSKAPDGRSLRLTAKAVGDASAGLRHLQVGTRVFAEGPYGAFTSLHQTTDALLLIAGGVGVTPIRALLEEARGDTVVLYRVSHPGEAVLLGELETLAAQRGAALHLLTGRTGEGQPPNTPFEPANLEALVPDVRLRDVYVCGPPPMTGSVLRALRALGVPRAQVHAERFSLA